MFLENFLESTSVVFSAKNLLFLGSPEASEGGMYLSSLFLIIRVTRYKQNIIINSTASTLNISYFISSLFTHSSKTNSLKNNSHASTAYSKHVSEYRNGTVERNVSISTRISMYA